MWALRHVKKCLNIMEYCTLVSTFLFHLKLWFMTNKSSNENTIHKCVSVDVNRLGIRNKSRPVNQTCFCQDGPGFSKWEPMHKKITSESESQHCYLLEVVICVTEVVVSLPNFLCSLISRRSLSNLKLKYTRVFKHNCIHNCITHSKVSRNIMAADAGNVPQLRGIITSPTVCSMHVQDDVLRTARRCNNFDFGFIW